MKNHLLTAGLLLAGALSIAGPTTAQVAGSTTIGVSVAEATQVAHGWSVMHTLLGKPIYNDNGEQVGEVVDLIIAPDRNVSYVIVGAGGFIGIGRHDVAIPVLQMKDQGGKLVMAGMSRDAVKSMPRFEYADDTARRDELVATAELDIAAARATVADLQQKATGATSATKARIEVQATTLQTELRLAEAKVGEMKDAGAKRWREFEADVRAVTNRLRKAVEKAAA